MNSVFIKITNQLVRKPKMIFLIDSLGALLTTLLLFGVLRNLEDYFGMPKTTLTFLSAIAACFCFYSTTCFLFLNGKWTLFIRIISITNLLYCVLTLRLLFVHYTQLTTLGVTYFLVEIAIVCGLVIFEVSVGTKILNTRKDNKLQQER
jgi:hypothetical protein